MRRGYYTASRRRTPARRLYDCATPGIALERSARATGYLLFPHSSFGRRERFDKRRPREQTLRVFHERRRGLGQLNAVVVEAPEQRGDRHIEHREVFAQQYLCLVNTGAICSRLSRTRPRALSSCFWLFPSSVSMCEKSSFSKRCRNSRARARVRGSAGSSCGCGQRSAMYSLTMFDSCSTRSRSTSTGTWL